MIAGTEFGGMLGNTREMQPTISRKAGSVLGWGVGVTAQGLGEEGNLHWREVKE